MTVDFPSSMDPQHAVIVMVKGDAPRASSVPTVELDLAKFQAGRWASQLDAVFARRREPAVILAQGVACLAVAWWAQLSPRSYLRSVQGALFLSPLSVGFGQEAIAAAARQGPSTRLPFPSVVASASSPFIDRLLAVADGWGSHVVEIGVEPVPYPTNRRAVHTQDAARLLVLLPLLQAAPSGDPLASVGALPAIVTLR